MVWVSFCSDEYALLLNRADDFTALGMQKHSPQILKFKWMRTNHQETHYLYGISVCELKKKKKEAMAQHLTKFIIENSKLVTRYSLERTAAVGRVLAFP